MFLFLIWFIASLVVNNSYVVPTISSSFKALIELFTQGHTYKVLGYTFLRLIVSITICALLGIILATLSAISYRFKSFITPFITLFKTLPIAVVITLILVVLRAELAVYYIISVVVFPIMYEATINGLESIPSDIKDEARVISKNTLYIYIKVYLPLALPSIITGLIQSFGLGLKVLVMAECIAQPRLSIGNEIIYYKDWANDMEYVFAWTLILISLVLATEIGINYLRKRFNYYK